MTPKPNEDHLREAQEISAALIEWFKSQEIPMNKAMMAMGYLIGTSAACAADDLSDMARRLQSVEDLASGIAIIKFMGRV